MSNQRLPPEILDYILDALHDEPKTLRDCCVVTKSWIPRARKHLFAEVKFSSPKDLKSWKETFPDPSTSPAHYVHTLSVKFPQVITVKDAEEGGWIRTFSRVVCFNVDSRMPDLNDLGISLSPFRGFSPILRSLRVFSILLPYSQILGLVRSLPLLEDLMLVLYGSIDDDDGDDDDSDDGDDPDTNGLPTAVSPPAPSPVFTGALGIVLLRGMGPIARRLLDLPNGLHFREVKVFWLKEDDLQWINALVVECCDTLESFDVTFHMFGAIIWFMG